MTTAVLLPLRDAATAVDLQTGDAAHLAGDAFPVNVVVDHEATDNSGLIPAVAALLIDLHRKRLAREQQAAEIQVQIKT